MENAYTVRDLRVYHAWQSQTALRILFENYEGVESRNLVALYVALTLKSTYNRFEDQFLTSNKEIEAYTGLAHNWLPTGMRTLEEAGLIAQEEARDEKGCVQGKLISLLDADASLLSREPKPDSRFCESVYIKKRKIESKDSTNKSKKKETSYDVKETPSTGTKFTAIPINVWKDFNDIVEYGIELNVISKPKTYEDGEFMMAPKYMKKAIDKLMRISTGNFVSFYKVDGKNHKPNNWREDIYKALDNFKIMKEDGRVWPTDKSNLPKNLDAFLINDKSGFSWFIKCLEPLSTQKEDAINEKYGDIVTDDYVKIFDKWFDYYFYEIGNDEKVNLTRNIGELIAKHKELWEEYGQYYTKAGKWMPILGGANPKKFLEFFAKFLMDKNMDAHENKLRPTSKTFTLFMQYLRKDFGINTSMTKEEKDILMNKAKGNKVSVTNTDLPQGIPDIGSGVLSGSEISVR